MTSRFGPICHVTDGAYRAVDRNGVLVVERADGCGALREVEWESPEQMETWKRAMLEDPSAQAPYAEIPEDEWERADRAFHRMTGGHLAPPKPADCDAEDRSVRGRTL